MIIPDQVIESKLGKIICYFIVTYETPEPSDVLTTDEYDMLTDIKHNTDTALSHARDQLLYLNSTLTRLKASGVKVLVLRIVYWELSLNIIDELMQQLLIERDVIDEYRVSNNNTRPEVQHVLNKLTRIIMALHSYVRERMGPAAIDDLALLSYKWPPPSQSVDQLTAEEYHIISEMRNTCDIAMKRARDQLLSLKSEAIDGLSRLKASTAQALALRTHFKEVKHTFVNALDLMADELSNTTDILNYRINNNKNITSLRNYWQRLDSQLKKAVNIETSFMVLSLRTHIGNRALKLIDELIVELLTQRDSLDDHHLRAGHKHYTQLLNESISFRINIEYPTNCIDPAHARASSNDTNIALAIDNRTEFRRLVNNIYVLCIRSTISRFDLNKPNEVGVCPIFRSMGSRDGFNHNTFNNNDTAHSPVNGTDTAHSPVNGTDTAHSPVNGTDTAHSPVNGTDTAHSPVNGTDTAHSPVNGTDTAHSPVNGTDTAHSPVNGTDTAHSPVNGTDTAHSPVNGTDTAHSPVNGTDTAHSPVNGTDTAHSPVNGTDTAHSPVNATETRKKKRPVLIILANNILTYETPELSDVLTDNEYHVLTQFRNKTNITLTEARDKTLALYMALTIERQSVAQLLPEFEKYYNTTLVKIYEELIQRLLTLRDAIDEHRSNTDNYQEFGIEATRVDNKVDQVYGFVKKYAEFKQLSKLCRNYSPVWRFVISRPTDGGVCPAAVGRGDGYGRHDVKGIGTPDHD
ncbi:unnamed protein product [Medioppia subpectinata]|uniref:Uncharacterized protein n=1 Tax=Medioppia subpectinata TaxID=1979941 RepID=A0A7R9KJZ2_9ACAR|nr:unnamed protein product [Medioppia subpectinata]CAG2104956.1 unnamed protein product [Medioppia subpectinata]